MSENKAIETRYAGCRFRSRIEARWAVFFKNADIPWEYEREGFELPTGRYLPDFWLPSIETWFEVKGKAPASTSRERTLLAELEEATGHRAVLAYGPIPYCTNERGYDENSRYGGGTRDIVSVRDFNYAWCVCPWCGKPGLEYEGRSARICGWQSHGITEADAWAAVEHNPHCWRIDNKCYTADDPRIQAAYVSAGEARFEHGETP